MSGKELVRLQYGYDAWGEQPNPELDQVIALGHLWDQVYKAFDFDLYDSEEQAENSAEERRARMRGEL